MTEEKMLPHEEAMLDQAKAANTYHEASKNGHEFLGWQTSPEGKPAPEFAFRLKVNYSPTETADFFQAGPVSTTETPTPMRLSIQVVKEKFLDEFPNLEAAEKEFLSRFTDFGVLDSYQPYEIRRHQSHIARDTRRGYGNVLIANSKTFEKISPNILDGTKAIREYLPDGELYIVYVGTIALDHSGIVAELEDGTVIAHFSDEIPKYGRKVGIV